jgi:hypothetical protein
MRGLTGGEGKVGEKVEELTAVTGWPVLGKRGAETASRQRTGAGGRAPRGGDGVPVAGGQERGGEVARKLSLGDVVLVVCWQGLRGGGASGRW